MRSERNQVEYVRSLKLDRIKSGMVRRGVEGGGDEEEV